MFTPTRWTNKIRAVPDIYILAPHTLSCKCHYCAKNSPTPKQYVVSTGPMVVTFC